MASGDQAPFPLASVTKLFIADDLLISPRSANSRSTPPTSMRWKACCARRTATAADDFWVRGGGNDHRPGGRPLSPGQHRSPYDGNWWNTMSTTSDLVRYAMLLDGQRVPRAQADMILANLAASSPLGADGYPQRFGIPDGLFNEPVAVKQGWMCCWNGPNWLHLSTGVGVTAAT